MNARSTAQELASYGRFGDSMLVHMNPLEVAGIASLVPGGMTINPQTGLPEAFLFLPFLASLLGGAAAPAVGAAVGAGAAGAAGSALASGLAAGTAAAGTTLGTLGAAAPALTTALSAPAALLGAAPAASTLGTLAGAGGSAASLAGGAGSALSSGLGSLTAAAPVHTALAAPAGLGSLAGHGASDVLLGGAGSAPFSAAPSMTRLLTSPAVPTSAPFSAEPSMTRLLTSPPATADLVRPDVIAHNVADVPIPTARPAFGIVPENVGAGAATTQPAVAPLVHQTPTSLGEVTPKSAMAAIDPTGVGPWGANLGGGPYGNVANAATTPKAGEGILGGIGGWLSKNPMMALMGLQMLSGLFKGGGGKKDGNKPNLRGQHPRGEATFPGPAYRPGHDPEYGYWRPSTNYANGGIVGLAEGGLPPDPQAQMPQDMSFPMNGVPEAAGIGSLATPTDIPESPFPTSQIGTEPEPDGNSIEAPTEQDKELIHRTVAAIKGQLADPQPVLLAFVNTFGEQAFQDLVQRVQATTQGKGDGRSDSIPAMVDGQQPAALSRGEFVVPADVVSGLGNGSTDAGAEQLQGMANNVRQAKTGNPGMPPPVNAGGIMSMMSGGLVT